MLEYAKATVDVMLEMPSGKKKVEMAQREGHVMEIPYLVNAKAIAPKTRLLALDDLTLHKIASKVQRVSEVFICIIGTPMCAKRSSARRCDGLGSCLGELHNLHHRHAAVCGAFIGSPM